MIRISVVTPVLNAAATIDETIASVVTQAGDFELCYHVQDGGSLDGTSDRLAAWKVLLDSRGYPVRCNNIQFTYSVQPDRGMYDCINRAFTTVPWGTLMTWINADDRIQPGAFQTAVAVTRTFPECDWFTGRTHVISEDGIAILNREARGYSRELIAAGLHDGEHLDLVQQEGTFWTPNLWEIAGGVLDSALELAGDYELWTRMARHAELFTIDTVLAAFRKRAGQKSQFIENYLAEVRGVRPPDCTNVWERFLHQGCTSGPVLRCSYQGKWSSERVPVTADAPVVGLGAGFGIHGVNSFAPVRLLASRGDARIFSPRSHPHQLFLTYSSSAHQQLCVMERGRIYFNDAVEASGTGIIRLLANCCQAGGAPVVSVLGTSNQTSVGFFAIAESGVIADLRFIAVEGLVMIAGPEHFAGSLDLPLWASGPECTLTPAGTASKLVLTERLLILEFRNRYAGQVVRVTADGAELGNYELPVTNAPALEDTLVAIPLPAELPVQVVHLKFRFWRTGNRPENRTAVLIRSAFVANAVRVHEMRDEGCQAGILTLPKEELQN